MKKVFAFALSLSIFGAVAAQPGRYDKDNKWNKNDRYEAPKKQDNRYDDKRVAVYNPRDSRYDNNKRMNDRERQQEIDRINRDYDRRVAEYRSNRRMSQRDRDYQIQVVEKERSSKLKPFLGSVLLGGILGAIISH